MRRLLLLLSLLAGCESSDPRVTAGKADVEGFVRQSFTHGITPADVAPLGPGAVQPLIALLDRPDLEPHARNIVSALGALGDARATEPLIRYLENATGEVSEGKFQALLVVPVALGQLAGAGDNTALQYLIARTQPAALFAFDGQKPKWSYGRYAGSTAELVLTQNVVMGLGASGRDEALAALQTLAAHPPAAKLMDNIREAIPVNRRMNAARKD